ncbi:hypothetical protein [Prosthecobacter sp.]|uniref:hypothetical protein n=1 Tax=Prosthecobacter sp. TaxID=1965333 RepID=UPI00378383D5
MNTVVTSIPDELRLELHQGEEIQFQALVQEDGSFLVTSVLHHHAPRTLGDWALKWAGTLHVAEGENAHSLRDAYLAEKFGA